MYSVPRSANSTAESYQRLGFWVRPVMGVPMRSMVGVVLAFVTSGVIAVETLPSTVFPSPQNVVVAADAPTSPPESSPTHQQVSPPVAITTTNTTQPVTSTNSTQTATSGTASTRTSAADTTSPSAAGQTCGDCSGRGATTTSPRPPSGPVHLVSCPDVASALPTVPQQAAAEVYQNLAELGQQITDADNGIAAARAQGQGIDFINNTVLGPLRDRRVATIDRIAIAIGRYAPQPTGLDRLAQCALAS